MLDVLECYAPKQRSVIRPAQKSLEYNMSVIGA